MNKVRNSQCRLICRRAAVWRVQDESPLWGYRATAQYGLTAQLEVLGGKVELLENLPDCHLHRAIDHDAEGALLVVFADKRHGVGEVRITQRGHRDQELIVEVVAGHTGSIGPDAGNDKFPNAY